MRILIAASTFGLCIALVVHRASSDDVKLPDILVELEAAKDGSLSELKLGESQLGSGAAAYRRLNEEILKIIGKPGNPLTRDIAVRLVVDPKVKYEYVVKAMSACIGRPDAKTGTLIRYVKTVKLSTPKERRFGFED